MTKSSITTPSLRDRKKGYPKHKCCRQNIYTQMNLFIKFASTLGVLVRPSFAGWGLARAPHAAVS